MVLDIHQVHPRKVYEDPHEVVRQLHQQTDIIIWAAVFVFICVAIVLCIMIWNMKI